VHLSCTGDRLRVEKRPGGWLVYSLGTSRAQDGGQIDPFLDFGVGPLSPLPDGAEK
jgi:hypothetical protein